MGNGSRTGTFAMCLFQLDLYKRNQGRLVRQLVAVAVGVVVCLLCWAMSSTLLADADSLVSVGVPVVLAVIGCWVVYRVVNYPRFADFLIEVQGEMAKVTWPGWTQLKRSTGVVLGAMFLLSGILFCCDVMWQGVLRALNVLQF